MQAALVRDGVALALLARAARHVGSDEAAKRVWARAAGEPA